MHKFMIAPLLFVFAACPDGDVSTTTLDTFVTSFSSTNATAFGTFPEGPTPTSDAQEPTGDESSKSTGDAPSTSGEDTTGEMIEPLPDAPSGCAHFVEILGNASAAERYVVIDMAGCPRSAVPELRLETFASSPVWQEELPRVECGVFGGPDSPAAVDFGGVVVPLGGVENDNATAWRVTVLVDGLPSDDLRVPAILQGQVWPGALFAPTSPVRRREDFSLVPTLMHVEGCALSPVP